MAKDYNITKTLGQCRRCEKQLAPDDEIVATVREGDGEFHREDYCPGCWDGQEQPDSDELFGVWRTRVPRPEEKKKLLVDDDLIVNFFERLEGSETLARLSYRFVLALVLMRKKKLIYDRTKKTDDGQDVWLMHFRGSDQVHEVLDPHMDEEKIAEVSQQLGEIMEGEL